MDDNVVSFVFLVTPDRSCRLLALRDLLTKKLTPVSFNVLKFIFQHFVKYISKETYSVAFINFVINCLQGDGKLQSQ